MDSTSDITDGGDGDFWGFCERSIVNIDSASMNTVITYLFCVDFSLTVTAHTTPRAPSSGLLRMLAVIIWR